MSRRGRSEQSATNAVDPGDRSLLKPFTRDFEDLGLSQYEARVVLGLLRLGSATAGNLARVSQVPRTSIYQVLETLGSNGLAERIPSDGPAIWASPGRDEILDRLVRVHERRLKQAQQRSLRLRDQLAEALGAVPDPTLPQVRILPTTEEGTRVFIRLLDQAKDEVVAFSRPPFTSKPGYLFPAVLDALARGVSVRAIYELRMLDAHAASYREEIDGYIKAGVEARFAEGLPMKLVVTDRSSALVAITEADTPDDGYVTNLLVENEGFSQVLLAAFEATWNRARPEAE